MSGERTCRACREPIADGAIRCPHCTARQDDWWTRTSTWVIGLIAVVVIVGGIAWWNAREEQQEQDQQVEDLTECMASGDC